METVSIIIPVYGVEKYLKQCLESVVKQTYRNLEILIIDDESPDGSGAIADRYSEEDSRIRVFHIRNRGAAGARNVGLDNCNGEYVMFVDSDDWLECNTVEILLESIKKNNSDIVQCSYYDEFTDKSVPHVLSNNNVGIISGQDFAEDMLTNWEDILLWNKLFTTSVLEGVRLEEGHCIDDEFFTYKAVIRSKTIGIINNCLYHYRNRKSSAMKNTEKHRQRLNDQIDFVIKRYEPLCYAFPQLKNKILQHVLFVLMEVMKNSADYVDTFSRAKKELMKYGRSAIFNSGIDRNIRICTLRYLISTPARFDNGITVKTDMDGYFE